MAKKRWDRNFSDTEYFWDKLTLCTLLELSTTTYMDRVNMYDGMDDDPIEEGVYFLKEHIFEIPEGSFIYDFMDIFAQDSDYKTVSKKTITKNQKESIYSKSKVMIRKHTNTLQNIRPTVRFIPWGIIELLVLVLGMGLGLGGNFKQQNVIAFIIIMAVLFVFSLIIKYAVERTLKKGKPFPSTMNQKLISYVRHQWAEEEIERLLDLYPHIEKELKKRIERQKKIKEFNSLTENEKKVLLNSMSNVEREKFYKSITKKEKEEVFFIIYQEIGKRYPEFFEACRKLGYIDEENHVNVSKQKDLINIIAILKNKQGNDLPLLQSIFKTNYPTYKSLSQSFSNIPEKAKDLVKDFDTMVTRIRTGTI